MKLRWNGSRFAEQPEADSPPSRPASRRKGQRSTEPSAHRAGWGALLALLASIGSAGCFSAKSQQLTCDDVYGPDNSSFQPILDLVTQQTQGGCGGPDCHGAEGQQHGLRLEEPDLIYDEMSHRPDLFYAYLSSGEMPQGGPAWTEDDLKAFRSWYCNGAFPP